MYKNMKIEITDEVQLKVVCDVLESMGYVRTQKNYLGVNIIVTDDDGEYWFFINDSLLDGFSLTTLAELKEM